MTKLVRSFAALGDATRMAIVERLLDKGAQSAGELLDVAEVSPPAISRHLKVLREAGVITRQSTGNGGFMRCERALWKRSTPGQCRARSSGVRAWIAL